MPEALRVTFHNSRTNSKGKAHNPNHNDRNFDISKAPHIDPDRQHLNLFWTRYQIEPFRKGDGSPQDKRFGFVAGEAAFYKERFTPFLDARNANRKKSRNRQQTMDEYRKARQSCPEETLFYLGGRNNYADPEHITSIMRDFIAWHEEKYPRVHFLNWSLHQDERGAPHVHIRKVWEAVDDAGRLFVGQEAALIQMGVQASSGMKTKDTKGKETEKARYNNRKKTYTADTLAKLQELARQYGYTIEDKPREKSKAGRELDEYIAEQQREEAAEMLQEAASKRREAGQTAGRARAQAKEQEARAGGFRAVADALDVARDVAEEINTKLKGFTLNPNTRKARETAEEVRETIEQLSSSLASIAKTAESMSAAPDFFAAQAAAERRIQRTRNACRRAIEKAKKARDEADERAEQKAAEATAARRAQLEEWAQKLRELDANLRQKIADGVQDELKAYKDDLERMESQAEAINDRVRAQKDEEKALQERLSDLQSDVKAAEKALSDAKSKEKEAREMVDAADGVLKETQEQLSQTREALTAARAEKPSESLLSAFKAFGRVHGIPALCDATKALHDEAERLTYTEWSSDEEETLAQELYNAANPPLHRGNDYGYSSPSYP